MIRERLKAATHQVHQRLHGHDGFAAAAAGTIRPPDYRALLARLYGFHAAFDAAMTHAPLALAQDLDLPARARSGLLRADLRGLGMAHDGVARLPRVDLAPLAGEAAHLGALYVVEGATLGGALIARALAAYGDNRRFYLGHGGENGRRWRHFLNRLERLEDDRAEAAERVALDVFAAFEVWMAGWRGALAEEKGEAA